jgi:hypothetical protein
MTLPGSRRTVNPKAAVRTDRRMIRSDPIGIRLRAPVFIVGAPRSGTTLLRVTLNRHPQLAMWGGELDFFRRLYNRRNVFGDPANERNRDRIVAAYLAIKPFRRLGLNAAFMRERMMSEGATWRDLFACMLRACADSQGKPYAGEKTPGHAMHVNTLCEWFPDCGIIHLVRDPRAAVGSLITMPWATRSVLSGARTWRLFSTAACAASARDNYLLVKYEDLVTRTEQELRRICGHIGLAYRETMLQRNPAESDPRPFIRRSYEGITTSRVGLWRQELEPWQLSVIEAVAGHRMQEFGYEPVTKRTSAAHMARATLEALGETTFQKLFRSPSAFYRFFQPANLADEEKWIERASSMYGRLRSRRPLS